MVLTSWHLLKAAAEWRTYFLTLLQCFGTTNNCTGPCYHCAARLSVARTARRPAASWRLGAAERSWHPVQELLGEAGGGGAASGVDHLLAAVEVPLEAAAEHRHVVLLLRGGGDLPLVESLDPQLVHVHAALVFGLGLAHAARVFQILCLVVPGLAEVHDDLRGAGVQRVEVGAVVLVQTLRREVVNTPQPVHKLRAHLVQLLLGGGEPEVLVVCDLE